MPRAAAAGGLVFVALFLSDGSSQSRLFWIGAAAVVVAAVGWAVWPPSLPPAAVAFFAATAAFVAWQGASIAWSSEPSRSWDYANRGLVYLAFAAVGALLGGVALRRLTYGAAALLGALFLWALAAKVIPGLYPDYRRLARLRYPVAYWNELGLLAAAAVPIGVWLLHRLRVAGALLLYAGVVVVVLTYSRVGIVLAVLAAVVALALDERRLEALGPLAAAWIAGAAVAGAGLLLPGISSDGQARHVRVDDGLVFGLALVVGAAAVWLCLRYVVTRAMSRGLVRAVAALLVGVIVAALAASVVRAGGPVGFVRDRWHEFSNPVGAQLAQTPGRLASTSSSNRWRWWQEAWNAFVDHPVQGTGAGSFGLTDRLERKSPLAVVEPHSTPLQFLSEVGVVGFLLFAALVVTAVLAIRKRSTPLVLALGVCLLHSFVDIDWDYVAVQGPVFLTVGALAAGPPVRRRGWLVAAAAAVCALAAVYSLASPWLSDHRLSAAYDDLTAGNLIGARDEAKAAHSFNPLAVEPVWLMAGLAPTNAESLRLYRQARDLEPKNAQSWYLLGSFELRQLKRPCAAWFDLNHAYTLDRYVFTPGTPPGRDLDRARSLVNHLKCRR
jgi:O-Antigen ligase